MIRNLHAFISENKDNVYECASLKQVEAIKACNILPIGEYVHNKTKKKISVFMHSDALSEILTQWKENKPPKIT